MFNCFKGKYRNNKTIRKEIKIFKFYSNGQKLL